MNVPRIQKRKRHISVKITAEEVLLFLDLPLGRFYAIKGGIEDSDLRGGKKQRQDKRKGAKKVSRLEYFW